MERVRVVIAAEDPQRADIQLLLGAHLSFAREVTPPGHVHALDIMGLVDPAVSFFAARRDGDLLGIGALKELEADHAEVKSMHTSAAPRGQGVGRAMVEHLLAVAGLRNYHKISLETGTGEAFMPARSLYWDFGFTPCLPFGGYTSNPYSLCMSLDLSQAGGTKRS